MRNRRIAVVKLSLRAQLVLRLRSYLNGAAFTDRDQITRFAAPARWCDKRDPHCSSSRAISPANASLRFSKLRVHGNSWFSLYAGGMKSHFDKASGMSQCNSNGLYSRR